jgi:ketosteroid isomerase-like protein
VPVDAAVVIQAYWAAANARDWDAFAALLAEDVVYELPQTRERIRGRDRYVQFNAEYPGDWTATVVRAVGTGSNGASWTTFTVDGESVPGLCFFDLDEDGRIARLADFWPEPYDPPSGREHLVERW